MRLGDTSAAVLLSDDGRIVLSASGVTVEALSWFEVDVIESEDLGLWIRLVRDGEPRVFLLRWDYILAVDIAATIEVARFGLRA